ncbi:hypothetical protein BSY240_4780 (plasmid) [Agrobacterium sp. RAC06]|nr:hypothetical protein BSY240_4780 [Agrobacterium sp. RAC06]
MGGDATAGFQDVAGDGEFVGRCADISKRIMQDEVLKMDEFAIDPERGMRLEEMRALEKTLADGGAGNALVETGKRDSGLGDRPQQALDG